MNAPMPTPVFRLIHVDNLDIYLRRAGMHSIRHWPDDGLAWRRNHDEDVQQKRGRRIVPCGPGGVLHDYIAFYLGPRSPMLFRLHTGWVTGYSEGQEPLIYLVSAAQRIAAAGLDYVFSDGHGIARFTTWFDNLARLEEVDWHAVYATWWRDTPDDPDRERRKQAEFLVWHYCPWSVVHEIAVIDEARKAQVERILAAYPTDLNRVVAIRREWYY